jgi:hypothetical protein
MAVSGSAIRPLCPYEAVVLSWGPSPGSPLDFIDQDTLMYRAGCGLYLHKFGGDAEGAPFIWSPTQVRGVIAARLLLEAVLMRLL